ncbi:response regulator [Mesorhizobium sp. AaZ16]|uniref:response regulator n=1 Tax=Mesorhizobium sp. AaZ16 TaxID=3402289 RepID=UPI00374E9EA5
MTSMQHSLDWAEMPRGAVKTQGQHTRATVIVADNHPLELRGLSGLLAEDSQILLVSICQDGSAALVTAKELAPDIAIVDFNLPGLSGLEFLKAVHSEQLPTRVILLTADLSDSDMFDVMASQPFGLVLKSAAADTLLACIHEVAAGRPWFPDENIDAAVARETYRRRRGIELWESLTERERDIAVLAMRNLPSKEIARILAITEGTAKIHLHHIYSKFHVANREALIVLIERFFDRMPPARRHAKSLDGEYQTSLKGRRPEPDGATPKFLQKVSVS